MKENRTLKTLSVGGMSCSGCELCIESKLNELSGIYKASASFSKAIVDVVFDDSRVSLDKIRKVIEEAGYTVSGLDLPYVQPKETNKNPGKEVSAFNEVMGILIVLFALYMLIKNTIGFNFIPDIDQNMSLGILFVIGLITSVHCLAMCGGINLSQNVNCKADETQVSVKRKLLPGFLYNAGRVISYTLIGGIVGAIGSVISFSGVARGIIAIIAGIFMMIMGLNMLNIIPWLHRFNIRMPKFLRRKIYAGKSTRGPFLVGLLNGLMPCGPLQTMQLYALGTGSFWGGALSMLVFSLGTVPLMFILGAVSSFLSSKFTRKMMKVSAVLVMVLGFVMLNRGLGLSGIQFGGTALAQTANVSTIQNDVQEITTSLSSGSYIPITVQKGIPVRWTIQVTEKDLNGCNNPMVIPKYDIQKELSPGDNIIEFTPEETGTIPYSCWMGMIRSSITVVDDVSALRKDPQNQSGAESTPPIAAGNAGGCCSINK